MTKALYDLRHMLITMWKDATTLEEARIRGIQNLYEEIVNSNQKIYGV